MQPKYITDLEKLDRLTSRQRSSLEPVVDSYAFRTNDYYLSLIDWSDPSDPIHRTVIPCTDELDTWGNLDPSDEKSYSILPGLEHKYRSTVLLLVSNVCGGICRYCFRKRIFMNKELLTDFDPAIDYIKQHPEVTNVLLTGGDPFMLATSKLEKIIDRLVEIDHVKIIRIGTKMPAFNPSRILDDPALLGLLKKPKSSGKQLYIMCHFSHPRELSAPAIASVESLRQTAAELTNQTPLIRGLNDHPEVLAELFKQLSFIGLPPYYLFQCRPAIGNRGYCVPIEQGYQIFEQAKVLVSGLAKRAKFVMSHLTGKIEIVGLTEKRVYLKYHRATDIANSGKFMIFRRNRRAYWFDDYDEFVRTQPLDIHYKAYGPD